MNILDADDMKNEIRVVLWYLKRKLKKEYGVTIEDMEKDLNSCGNPVIASLWKNIKGAADEIKETYQKNTLTEFPIVALWTMYRDTAYTNPFMYIMKKVLDDKDKMMPYIDKYYLEPKDWYVNQWNKAKEHTNELKERGLIADESAVLSEDEKVFIPHLQKKRWEEIDSAVKKKRRMWNLGLENIKSED